MFFLIPAPIHRSLLRLAHRVRVKWWRFANVRLADCRVLALDPGGRVLLVRHSYGSGHWMLPGGAPRRGENPVAAACRELAEETGCHIAGACIVSDIKTGNVHRHIVAGKTHDAPQADNREIIAAAFFDPRALPQLASAHQQRRMMEWIVTYQERADPLP